MRKMIVALAILLLGLGSAWAGQNATRSANGNPLGRGPDGRTLAGPSSGPAKGMVAKTDIRLKVEALASMTPGADLGQLASELKGMEACVCAPLVMRFDLSVIPITCQCRKKGTKLEIKP